MSKKQRRASPNAAHRLGWHRYHPHKTLPKIQREQLRDTVFSQAFPRGNSIQHVVRAVASELGLSGENAFVSPVLCEPFIRGITLSGTAGEVLNRIAGWRENVVWWITDTELHVEVLTPESELSDFDRYAGELTVDAMRQGKLSAVSLRQIAEKLDAGGFALDNLEPAFLQQLKEHNRKYARRAIKTYAAAITNPRFSRGVRQRLHRARGRLQKESRKNSSLF